MIRCYGIILLICLMTGLYAAAQDPDQLLREGNAQYSRQEYREAEATYTRAIELQPANMKARFNRANTLVRLSRMDEAVKEFDEVAFRSTDNAIKAQAYYNKGVVYSGQNKLDESITAYKKALMMNPADSQARENLQKALLEQKKRQPQKKQENKPQPQQKKQQPQPRMNEKEARQRLRLLEQKEKNVQERLQKERSKNSSGSGRDW